MAIDSEQSKSYAETPADAITSSEQANSSGWQRVRSALLLVVIFSGLVWLGMNNPLGQSMLPRCPSEQFLGFYCPGCGSTRATHYLLNARLSQAMGYNPMLVIIGIPVGIWYLIRTSLFVVKGKRLRLPGIPSKAGYAALVVLLLFTASRNLPMSWADALRPTEVEKDRESFEQQQPQPADTSL